MFCYTGHPLYDIGLATVTAFVRKKDPSQVTQEDLNTVASFIEREYVREPLKSFLGVAFTTNAWFNQPAFAKQPEKRRDYANRILRNRSQSESLGELCVFTGRPVSTVAFSDSLLPGRAFRQHIPLLTGEGVINFHPYGDAGLPVSGEAAFFIQAFPLGCAKCGGKLLAVHSDNPELTQEFAATFLELNRMGLSLAHQSKSRKMPEAKASAKTLLIDTLLSIEQRRLEEAKERRPFSVTAYHLTNSGQSNPLDGRNPPLEIYQLPLELTEFLFYLKSPKYRLEWDAIAKRAWRLTEVPKKVKRSNTEKKENKRPQKNFLYEDMFQLPENAARFVRQYFLRIPTRGQPADDPRGTYSLRDEASLVSWKVTELFLMKVMNVDKERIKQIRDLADQLATYISKENDSKFFTAFFREQRYDYFRNNLIKVNLSNVKRGNPPLIRFDPFIEIFEEGSDIIRPDWKLSRDLVLIRMVEQLYKLGWLGKNIDILPMENDNDDNMEGK